MFTGVDFKTAIDLWEKGREVIVIDRSSQNTSGGYDNFPFEELFRGVELLADVPAVENPVFAEAVADMVQEPREGETVTPPLKGAGGRGYASGRRDQERDRHKACRTGEDDKPDSEGDRDTL